MTGSASDKALLRPHIYNAQVKKRLEKRFKNPGDPLRLVIVRDMWLTGFDAPCVHTLYVDKPMKGHNLMQAIARVNRVFKDKQGGLVVDYIGIANELKSALKEYTASHAAGGRPWTRMRPSACWPRSWTRCGPCCTGTTTAALAPGAARRWPVRPTLSWACLLPKGGTARNVSPTWLAMSKAFTLCVARSTRPGGAGGSGLLSGRESDSDEARDQRHEEDK